MCKIAILENYSLFCSGIRPVLEKILEFEVVTEAKQLKDFIPLINKSDPDVIIIDVLHCDQDGIVPVKKIRAKATKTPILLIVSKEYSEHFENYIALGVNGLLSNSSNSAELVDAVKTLKRGGDYFPPNVWILLKEYLRSRRKDIVPERKTKKVLSSRELDILKLFCKGYTYKEIANNLNISPRTVETHKKNITSKINVRSTAEMVEYAIQNNLT
ncbi:LuxR C-terminal-related transcriptional regulator [Maribellus sediminis]|uniref:response regulator transcription factor n=1 Tax=Maribellus sediminis TaxID=2696285 RepID=UPI00142FB07E|nr:response regulator transcription factor [Maribellus sediminis]